tara:strand:- start:94 stop:411 length:318 start_codon:yes stop_codon:yes gene_type:complete
MTMWELIKLLFVPEAELSPEEKVIEKWAEAVRDSNWVRLHTMAREDDLTPPEFFDKVAEAYCHVYAAGVEPKRNDAWTAFRKTLENLHYPLLSECVAIRAKEGNG